MNCLSRPPACSIATVRAQTSSESQGVFEVLNQYYGDYITIVIFIAVGAVLVGAAVMTSKLIAPNAPSKAKSTAYESGIDPLGGGWNQSHIRYYIFALLFLIFDVEAVFMFPWALQLEYFDSIGRGVLALTEMIVFIVILLLGLVYALRKGVVRWE